jgi:hypothetical protein
MENMHNNLMKLGGPKGNVPQKLKKKLVIKLDIFRTVSPFSRVQFILSYLDDVKMITLWLSPVLN